MKLAIGYPGDMSQVFLRAAESIWSMERPPGAEVRWVKGHGWCQARRRIDIVEKALAWGADRIVMIDLDQTYEPDFLLRLVARQDELGGELLPPVAAMVPGRTFVPGGLIAPFQRLAWRSTDGGKGLAPIDPAAGNVQEATFPTCAAVIFDARVFERLGRPWFYVKFKPENWGIQQGEDTYLFLRLQRELNLTSYVDTTLRVGHLHPFVIDESFPARFADWEHGGGDPDLCFYKSEPAEKES